jgi:hypothetical protein
LADEVRNAQFLAVGFQTPGRSRSLTIRGGQARYLVKLDGRLTALVLFGKNGNKQLYK